MNRQQGSIARAFTLVEVLIVVIILGILAAVVVPQFSNASQEATGASLKSTLDVIKDRVDYEKHQSPTSQYPTAISPTWFASQIGPLHPENSFGVPNVQILSNAGMMHPTNKVLKAGVTGAFWYNPTEGVIRARVKDQGTSASTLTFYNDVNDSNETSLGNYTGGAS